MSIFTKLASVFGGSHSIKSMNIDESSLKTPTYSETPPTTEIPPMTEAAKTYANMTVDEKVISLEKAVAQQGDYLVKFKEAMKILNRRNTLAVIELQKLVRDCEMIHPDLRDTIDPVMTKVSEVLDFKKPYDI